MKSFWINLAVEDLKKSANFYKQVGFTVNQYGEIYSVTLPEGGNLILFQREEFKIRVPFKLSDSCNEVLISLNVSSNEEVEKLVEAGGSITTNPTYKYGFYGASFTDLDNHQFNVIVM